jgi:UDP-2,3-diacylglucosamine pyrophosphatase LpxH
MDPEPLVSPARAVFVADAHLSGDDVHARSFLLLAQKAAAEGTALFLLGDVFDLWFGSPALTFGFQAPIIEELRSLRRAKGLRLFYVEGNRDFYLKRYHAGTTFDAVSGDSLEVLVGPRRVYASHGDLVNRADRAYRFWRAVSKNPVAFGVASLLPSSFVLPLTIRVERGLKPSNPRFKGCFPEREVVDFAERIFEGGPDCVVLGHFHTERLLTFGEDGRRVLAVLPAWREEWRYFYLAADGSFGFKAFRSDAPLVP